MNLVLVAKPGILLSLFAVVLAGCAADNSGPVPSSIQQADAVPSPEPAQMREEPAKESRTEPGSSEDKPGLVPAPTSLPTPRQGVGSKARVDSKPMATIGPRSSPEPSPSRVPTPPPTAKGFPSGYRFNPKDFDVGCTNQTLGAKATNEIFYDGREPTTVEQTKMVDCHISSGRQQPSGGETMRQGDRRDDQPQNPGEDRDPNSSRNEPRGLVPENEGRKRLPEGVLSAELRDVNLPLAMYNAPASVGCEIIEGTTCAELRWERTDGLLAGAITALQVAPTDANVIYAGLDSNGMSLWKSEDGGSNWTRVYAEAHASDVAISPSNPTVVLYSELEEGVHITRDGGTSWRTAIGSDNPDWVRTSGLYFKALAFSTDTHERAYAVASHERGPSSGAAKIYRSEDGGITWALSGSCEDCGSVYTALVQPGRPNMLWVAGDLGVKVSRDSGVSWSGNRLSSLGPQASATIGLAIHPSAPDTILAATSSSGLYRSTDGGQTWRAANLGLASLKTHQVAFAPSDNSVAWLTTHDGVYRSTDAGETWDRRDRSWQYSFTNALAIDPVDPSVVYVGTAVELHTAHTNHVNQGIHEGGGLYKTVDGGTTWRRVDQDMEESSIVSMATHPYLPFNLWVGDKAGRGAFVTPDAGGTWLHAAWRGAHYPMVFAFSRSFPATHYLSSAVTMDELTASSDGGSTWRSLSGGLGAAVDKSSRASRLPSETSSYFHVHLHGLAVAPSDPNVLYTGTIYDPSVTEEYSMMGAVIFTSRDAGSTWQESSNGFPIHTPTSLNAFVVHPTDPNIAYAMTSGYESETAIGIYKTENGGALWRPANKGLDLNTRDLQMDLVSPDTLYAATESGVYKTVNGGESWQEASDGLPTASLESAQRRLVSAFKGSGDRGIFDLALDPINPLQLYAATKQGVYKTKDGGSHWYPVNLGLPVGEGNPFWHDRVLEIDATGRVLYAALAQEENGRRGDTQIYRAILGPLLSVGYEFEVNGSLISIDSNSYVYDMVFEEKIQELRFSVAGPNGMGAEMELTMSDSLIAGQLTVSVDGKVIPFSMDGQKIVFVYSHAGRSDVVIRGD
ncbi:hypothetical protein M1O29_03150 [Dehalococcoidia bacterium]|nr:hypothetical protein [Dehalococcoidia bacterium]